MCQRLEVTEMFVHPTTLACIAALLLLYGLALVLGFLRLR